MLAQRSADIGAAAADRVGALAAELLTEGYLILPNLAPRALLERLYAELDPHFAAAHFGVGAFYGAETKRFGSVLRRSKTAADLVLEPTVYGVVERVLRSACDCVQLNLTQAIEIHPGAPVQAPHRDQDMWGGPKGPCNTWSMRCGRSTISLRGMAQLASGRAAIAPRRTRCCRRMTRFPL